MYFYCIVEATTLFHTAIYYLMYPANLTVVTKDHNRKVYTCLHSELWVSYLSVLIQTLPVKCPVVSTLVSACRW